MLSNKCIYVYSPALLEPVLGSLTQGLVFTSGLSFEILNTIAPDVVSHINILYRHWIIIYLIALYCPLVVIN